ncbi:inactive serine/threonine-protein kinase TEX14 isoform X2 [Amia ocellicauda]|uniref:inactive serine/threonine-protein kinase TEX14 isoform X2 n=1 Tax=Amia ocellicauda TaxID=2972642 RepID=UPI0034645333
MAQSGGAPVPCPVRLGRVIADGAAAQLHGFALERNTHKLEKLLKRGVDVDVINNLGQTPLFCAALLGLTGAAELLLEFGADPNHRCEDRSTPVHAAVFSCNPVLLSALLDAGGDLRLHDAQGRTPEDWAQAGAQEHSPRMLSFLQRCVAHMQTLTQQSSARDPRQTGGSCKALLPSPTLLERLKPGSPDYHVTRRTSSKPPALDLRQCFGFGQLCAARPRQRLDFLAGLPLIEERELQQAEYEPLLSHSCGSYMTMTNYSWKGCRVTVKELQPQGALLRGPKGGSLDWLIAEQEHCSRLLHPHLLQLLGVGVSPDLQTTRLVFERVYIGSLYSVLHLRRCQFPVLPQGALLGVALQVCGALLFLHGRSLVMRSLSSHAVQLVRPGVAKLTGLHCLACSDGDARGDSADPVLPLDLYNWAAPEAIRGRPCTSKADLYSMCALLQELFTDAVPWGVAEPRAIRHVVECGHALQPDPRVPTPYYELLRSGLQPRAQHRTPSLRDLRLQLHSDVKGLCQHGGQRYGLCPETELLWGLETWQDLEQTGQRPYVLPPDPGTSDSDSCLGPEGTVTWDEMEREGAPAPAPAQRDDRFFDAVSAIMLDLKVSQVLVQQAENSLLNVERAQAARARAARALLGQSRALGPLRSRYCLPVDEDNPISEETELFLQNYLLSHWQDEPSAGEGPSSYSSALDASFATPRATHSQAGRGGVVTTGQYCHREQPSVSRLDTEDRRAEPAQRGCTPASSRHKVPGSAAATNWKREVSEVVERMVSGLLGAGGRTPSSQSQGTEERVAPEQEARGSWRQDPHDPPQRQGSPPASSTEPERLFKSFAGVQSESEEDAQFLSVNRTFDLSAGRLERRGPAEEDSSSETDDTVSPAEVSLGEVTEEFFTPRPPGSRTQTPSSEDELEVTMEVCGPSCDAAPARAPGELDPAPMASGAQATEEKPADGEGPAAPPGVSSPAGGCLPDITELSSIACEEDWSGRQTLGRLAPSTRVSTPRSPGAARSPSSRPVGGDVAPLQSLLDTSPWSSRVTSEAFNTAPSGTIGISDPSVSGVLPSPRLGNAHTRSDRRETEAPGGGTWTPGPQEERGGAGGARGAHFSDTDSTAESDTAGESPDDDEVGRGAAMVPGDRVAVTAAPGDERAKGPGCHGPVAWSVEAPAPADCPQLGEASLVAVPEELRRVEPPGDEQAAGQGWPEEMDRAHSTLDEALQGMLGERDSDEPAMSSTGPETSESKGSEGAALRDEDTAETREKPGQQGSSAMPGEAADPKEQGEGREPAQRGPWSHTAPHRYHTPCPCHLSGATAGVSSRGSRTSALLWCLPQTDHPGADADQVPERPGPGPGPDPRTRHGKRALALAIEAAPVGLQPNS